MSDTNIDIEHLSPGQVQEFLTTLLDRTTLKHETIVKMDELYNFSSSCNCNILYGFLKLGIKARWEPSVDITLGFLKTMGRLHFAKPLYRELFRWPEKNKQVATFFNNHKHLLMSAVVDAVAKEIS